jgi:hypothetical protein
MKLLRSAVILAMAAAGGLGQATPPAILQVDVANQVEYDSDISNWEQVAVNPSVTHAMLARNFDSAAGIADIVAVNGQPAKGTIAFRAWGFLMKPAPDPGGAIADITRVSIRNVVVEIMQRDGTPAGSIMAVGMGGGSPPPGAPLAVTQMNFAIVGGTGAFLGARGQLGLARNQQTINPRLASIAEDPGNRRLNGGGKLPWILHVIPMVTPQIVSTRPRSASAGEVLSVTVTGLGPTRLGVNPGQPFPAREPAAVNSPVEVKVNGNPAEVLAANGLPGTVDHYEVKLRLPPETGKGSATIQISAAWVASPPVRIRIQ